MLILSMGEVEYNKLRLQDALRWITSHPSSFAKLTVERVFTFWFPSETGRVRDATTGQVILWVATVLSVPGIVMICGSRPATGGLVLLWLVLFPAVYYLVGHADRYRYPILWATFLPAGVLLSQGFETDPPR